MKVAIVTLIGDNYGNRLQNYALQKVLEKKKLKVETLRNVSNIEQSYSAKLKRLIKRIAIFHRPLEKLENEKRHSNFKKFDKEYIKYSRFAVSNEKISTGLRKEYDYFICGSDQIWNPNYKQNGRVNFLGFVESSKKVSYAASIGSDMIPMDRIDELKEYLDDFKIISIRERSNVRMLKEIVNKPIDVHVDPTLLLNESDWKLLEKKPLKMINDKYLFTYFLGKRTNEQEKMIIEIANRNKLKIIDLCDKKWYSSIGPSEFLYLISNSSFICTDSFHGVVFSLIYKKNFISYSRNGIGATMSSRLISLLDLVGLDDRYDVKLNELGNIKEIDYFKVDEILFEERKKSNKYIDNMIINKN
ncbi:hypothetical protein TPELB_10220 [Terrisporobacter petrolearius]|uniref:Polysaccharide pyruvyl transferase domain-containing protein n=1 Tax=Terrisporobacter petrolearius TaxID=1460447 RepID=A0ABZ3FAA8_9FIRM